MLESNLHGVAPCPRRWRRSRSPAAGARRAAKFSCRSISTWTIRTRLRELTERAAARAGAAPRLSAHPELVDQDSALRAELVVADALREHVDGLQGDERHPGCLGDGLPVDALPEAARGLWIRHLLRAGALDLPVDARVAERAQVDVQRVVREE